MSEYFKLSTAQTRIYIDQLLNPVSSFANICYLFELKSKPGPREIIKALNRLLRAQKALRFKFTTVDGEICQYIAEYFEHDFETLEFDSEECEQYRKWVDNQAKTVFKLYDSEMFCFTALNFKNGGSGFLARVHHLVFDGMSVRVFNHYFMEALAESNNPDGEKTLTEEKRSEIKPFEENSYIDFLKCEDEYIHSEKFVEHGEYWMNKLSPLPEPNPFFEGKTRIKNIKSSTADFYITAENHLKIIDYCLQFGVTRFTVFISAVLAYFSKASGLTELLAGFPHHGRINARQKKICGMFVSTVPFKISVSHELEFRVFAKNVFSEIKAILRQYHRYPLNYIASEFKKKKSDLPGALDINVIEIPASKKSDEDNYKVLFYSPDEDPSVFNIYLVPGPDERNDPLNVKINYRSGLFKPAEIALIFERIIHFISQAVTNPEIAIKDISILTESERRKLLIDFNDTRADYPLDKTIHELFREAAAEHSEKTALVFCGRRYSYGQLDSMTGRLANYLIKKGVGPSSICGILVERSEDIIISLLGILKAGAAYLPIDPQYPDERIAYMLKDSAAAVLLSQSNLRGRAGDFTGERIDLDAREFMSESSRQPLNFNSSGDPAYIIYTSGSTGAPKGVVIEHRNIVNLCKWQNGYHGVTHSDVTAAYSGFSFDASIWEMLPFITCGAEVHIISEAIRLDINELNNYFNSNGITITNLPTQFCEQFMEIADNRSLKTLVTGGDKLRFYRPANYKLVNEYGPTEYTISATAFTVDRQYDNIPIGRPLANTWLYIVNSSAEIVPIGAPGELWIAGAQMARGYLNRPDLNAQKFIDNPFKTCDMNSKVYKTGDLVRWTTDGVVEYLGRIDQQVKIRGYRIEPGEIEQQLLNLPQINDAAVIDITDKAGNKYLAAYLVVKNGVMDREVIKNAIAEKLPEYMIPSHFIMLERIPLTPNGKVDRRALPEPVIEETAAIYEAPETNAEKILAGLWSDILKIEKIGLKDDFFILGGNSLNASVLQSKIQKVFKVKIPLADIFEYSLLKTMAARLKTLAQADLPELKKASKMAEYPLTTSQMSVYILNDNQDSLNGYSIPMVNIIEGKSDCTKLENAIDKVIKRHESLRTRFERSADAGAVQIIEDEIEFQLQHFHISEIENISGSDNGDHIDHIANSFIKRFELSNAPLVNAALIELSGDRALFVLSVHHIVFDGASAGIFMNEIRAFYNDEELPEPLFQYKDYIGWRREFKESAAYKNQEKYWLETYSDGVPPLNLTFDFIRPAVQSFKGAKHYFTIDADLLSAIEKLAAETGATLYQVLLGALYCLLYKYTGQQDIVVGTPVAGRPHDGLSGVIGMFVNTVVVRAQPRGVMPFIEFLGNLKQSTLAALDNQHYEFFELVKKLGIERDPGRNPIFDVMFVLQNAGDAAFNTNDFKMKPWKLQNGVSQVDLTLEAEKIGTKLELLIEYCVKLFRPDTIERMAGHYLNILKALVRNPDIAIDQIDMLSAVEKKGLLEDFNKTALPAPLEKTVPELFSEQVLKHGAKIALVCADVSYTYDELDKKTDRLAAFLPAKGIGPDRVAAVMVKRSADIMINALSIMKAGGAYLPIDPGYPPERIAYMLEDSGALLLLTQKELSDKFMAVSNIEWFDPGDESLYISHGKSDQSGPERPAPAPSDLAYVIYTSGSTGKPKGVMIEQRNLVNLCAWHNHFHSVTFEDAAAAYSGFGFDASIWEMFPFITCGAALHIITDDIRLDPEELDRYFTLNNITITNFPTQFCEQFMEMADGATLKTLVTGGDKLRSFKKRDYRLVNEYGPTEYTISATAFVVEKYSDNIPIGKPLANTWIYILDGALNLMAQGAAGELCIAGAQMARGYLNRPELSAEKFVKNPYAVSAMNEILYRTGDLARWLPDGNIEFLGRIDQQVKIRGYRIEPGEIEQRLLSLPGVSNAVVLDLTDKSGMKYLCAYMVATVSEADLKASLAKELPDYMVPSVFVFVDNIPLTPNGKIDKKALPVPQTRQSANKPEYAAPRGEREEALASVWSGVLGVDKPGANDNFFNLGGDSIKVIQIAARLKKYGYNLDTRKIFQAPTIAKLAGYLEGVTRAADNTPVSGAAPLTPIQKWFFEQNFKFPNHWNQSIIFEAADWVDEAVLRTALKDIITHHDALRMIYTFGAGGVSQYNREAGKGDFFNLTVFQLNAGCDKDALDEINSSAARLQQGVDIQVGILLHAGLFKARPDSGIKDHVALIIHHLVIDAVSWDIIRQDLSAAYSAGTAGRRPEFIDKTVSYKEWAERIEQYASSASLQVSKNYWRAVDSLKIDALPDDSAILSGRDRVFDKCSVEFELSPEDTSKLLDSVRDSFGAAMEEVLLAGLSGAVKEWSAGQAAVIAVTLESHGRTESLKVSAARTVGWFTATYPVVFDSTAKDWRALVKYAKESIRSVPDHGFDYEIIHWKGEAAAKKENALRIKPEIEFNYFGDIMNAPDNTKDFFAIKQNSAGEDSDPREAADFKWYIGAALKSGALKVTIGYDGSLYRNETMQNFCGRYIEALKAITAACAGREREYTRSDIADSGLSEEEFQSVKKIYGPDVEKIYPLAPMQEGMLFFNMSAGTQSCEYLEQAVYRLAGDMDEELFAANFSDMLAYYDILRTGFAFEDIGAVRQIVMKKVEARPVFIDCTTAGDEDMPDIIERMSVEERKKGFDLRFPPLFRVTVLKFKGGINAIILTFLHIILDGWSAGLIEKFLLRDYCFIKAGRRIKRGAPPSFANYINWLGEQDSGEAADFWRGYLAGITRPTFPPGARSAAKNQGETLFADKNKSLSKETAGLLRKLAADYNVTVSIVLQALWGIVLMRYNSAADAVIGLVTSGRGAAIADIEETAGLFINTIPVRISLSSGKTFSELIVSMQEKAAAAEKYSWLSLSEINSLSGLSGGLINVLLSIQTVPGNDAGLPPGFELVEIGGFDRVTYDFSIVISPSDGINIRFNYNAAIYSEDIIDSAAEDFETLARQILDAPEAPLNSYILNSSTGGEAAEAALDSYKLKPFTGGGAEPGTPAEIQIAEVWKSVLYLETIGVNDDFFASGGNSIKAITLVSKLSKKFVVKVKDIFAYPTISAMAANLEPKPAASAAAAQPAENIKETAGFNITRAAEKEYYPLSYSQKRMYVLDTMQPGGSAYHITTAISIEGALDRAKFGRAVDEVIKRHESLRTSFTLINGEPFQKINQTIKLKKNFRKADESAAGKIIEEFIKPFDLAKAPLFRILLIETGPGRHIFVMDFHHIIIDGISLDIFYDELFKIHIGIQPGLPQFQYKDYSEWESSGAFERSVEEQKKFWLETFKSETVPLLLPYDRPRPSVRATEGGLHFFYINPRTTAALKKIAAETGSTMFMVLLAAFNVLLHKYSASEDIVVGAPCSGRADSSLDGVIGMFVSTLPVRNYPRASESFRKFLDGVKINAINSFQNQQYPFDRLVEELKVKRDPSRNPLFDVMFSYNEKTSINAEGLKIENYDASDKTVQFDLTFDIFNAGGSLEIAIEYAAALFDSCTIERMAGHTASLLEHIAANPDALIADIDIMSETEKQKVLLEFNDTRFDAPFDKTVHELFKITAAEHNKKTALVFKDRKYTYGELDAITDKLAMHLRKKGVKPDTVSAILVKRSEEIIIAMLGVMKAGGAYLPIDPAYPDERIRYMIEDSKAIAVLGNTSLKERIEWFGGEWIDLDSRAYMNETGDAPVNINKPSDLVYLIYTSGSTGKPKGVMIEHRNLVNLSKWHNAFHSVTSKDRAASYSGFSFDASIWEMTPFLICGAEVHIIADELRLSPEALDNYFNRNAITITNLPTQFCEQFMETGGGRSLKTLVTGGDKLRNYSGTAGYRLVNEYGPTEYTISATAFIVDRYYDNIPIGKPIANTWLYVVDGRGRPVSIGTAGELWISGAQIARGYINRPELTAEKFIDNPFKTCELNSRVYRTGDLVRWTADGYIEFLGRIDQQVKIRGYRIEPGEIERQIMKYSGVKDSAVIDLDDATGNKYLAAYLVCDSSAFKGCDDLKRALAKELPEYMIPSYFTEINSIPLTPNGKIDRRALPAPLKESPAVEFIEPAADNEVKIARAWKEVLGVEKIGVNDDFFLIGGNSIRAIAVVYKLSRSFNISINDIFEHQVLGDLARNIRSKQNNLKVKLAAIMDEMQQGASDTAGTDIYNAEVEKVRNHYETLNAKYSELDFSGRKSYQNILLTGATGFLGAHLCKTFLSDPDGARLTLIVRGRSHEDAKTRVAEKMAYYFGDDFIQSREFANLTVYCGDLGAPRLGLSMAEYETLSSKIDALIHSAANVKHYGHYDELYRDNVTVTINLLEFAGARKAKDFAYVSTVSVGSGSINGRKHACFTEYDLDCGQTHDNYYLKTKFLAEKEVLKARESGINTSVFRVGNLVFDSAAGIFQQNIADNAFYNQIKSYLNIGAVPEIVDEAEFSFVDIAAGAIHSLFGRQALLNETFHVWNPETIKLSELFTDKSLALGVEKMTLRRFADYLYDNFDRPGISKYAEQIMTHLGWLDDADSDETLFDVFSNKTEMILEKIGFEWPKLDITKLSKTIKSAFTERIEFLKSVPVFSAFSEDELVSIAGQARQKVCKNNEDLLWEGVESEEFYLLVDGCVEICRNSIDGWTGTIMVNTPQSLIGEENFILKKPSCITAESIMGDSLVLAFNNDKLRERIMNNPGAAAELLKLMAEKITRLEKLIVSMG